MKNRIKLWLVGIGIIFIAFILFLGQGREEQKEEYRYTEEYVQIKELPVLLDFYYFSKEEWEEKFREQEFGEIVTPVVVEWICEQTGSTEYITFDKESNKINRADWNEIYAQLLDLLDDKGAVSMVDEVILKKEKDTLVCALGTYGFSLEGLETEPMKAMSFYIKDGNIIGIHSLKSKSASLQNVFIKHAEEGKIEFLKKGEQYTLSLAMEDAQKVKGHVCDLLWENGEIAKVQVKEDTIQGDLIAVDEEFIEIEGYGKINRSAELPVYKTYGTVE